MTIELYTWGTPNGRKISILLEELGVPYAVHAIDISKNEQFSADFLAINPNNKIPAIVDRQGPGGTPLALFESGAILVYLAKKCDSQLLPDDQLTQAQVLQWLMFRWAELAPCSDSSITSVGLRRTKPIR